MFDSVELLTGRGIPLLPLAQPANNFMHPKGRFHVEHYNKDGKLLGTYDFPNGITNEGKDFYLDVMFSDVSAIPSTGWYIGLIDTGASLDPTDLMNSHAGWTEFNDYSDTERQDWGPGAASSQSITNATPATFNIDATGTVYGVFIVTVDTIDGTTGVLWATAAFSSEVPVSNGDQLKVTYTTSA